MKTKTVRLTEGQINILKELVKTDELWQKLIELRGINSYDVSEILAPILKALEKAEG